MLIRNRVYNQVAYQKRPALVGHVTMTGTSLGVNAEWETTLRCDFPRFTCYTLEDLDKNSLFQQERRKKTFNLFCFKDQLNETFKG